MLCKPSKLFFLFCKLSMLQVLSAQRLPDTVYYNLNDFWTVKKIDAHVHVRTNDPAFLLLSRKCNFRLLTITTDEPPGIDNQNDYARHQMKLFPDILAYATTFSVNEWTADDWQSRAILKLKQSFSEGAAAVKVYKNIGMELRDKNGNHVMIDNPRFDSVINYITSQKKTIIGHLGEPRNCWLPIDEMSINSDKRYFSRHPEYHMYLHSEYPAYEDQLKARDAMLIKHPELKFVGAHLGSLEWSLEEMSKHLDRFPNDALDMAARLSHLELHAKMNWKKTREFIIKYQDRLLYGTDRIIDEQGEDKQMEERVTKSWVNDWKFFTTSEVMESAAFEGTFKGLKLPRKVIDKIYRLNAEKYFTWK
ncbi:Amidohydrolase [bacterium A37T11]|nr:Amidohydrolase [bacterium A37T11]